MSMMGIIAGGTVAGPSNPSTIFTSNLMCWLEAVDGISGTTFIDRSTHHNNLTQVSGNPTIGGTSFNGNPGYVFSGAGSTGMASSGGFAADGFPAIGTGGAIFLTINESSTSSTFPRLVSASSFASVGNDSNNVNSIALGINDSGSPLILALFNSTGNASASFSFSTYHRVGVVWNSTTVWTYFDGSPTDSGVSSSQNIQGLSPPGANVTLAIGCGFGSGGNPFKGVIGDMVVVGPNYTPTGAGGSGGQIGQLDAYFRATFGI